MSVNLVNKRYVSMRGRGNVDGLTELIKKITNILEPLFSNGELVGYSVYLVHNSQRIEDAMLDESKIRVIVEDIFPVVMVAIMYYSTNADQIHEKLSTIEDKFELKEYEE